MAVDEIQEPVEDGLFARPFGLLLFGQAVVETVVVVHERGHEAAGSLAVVIVLANHLPECFDDAAGGLEGGFVGLQLEVAHLAVEGCRQLFRREWHGKLVEKGNTQDFQVVGNADRGDDGARAEIDQRAGREVTVLKVEVDGGFALDDNSQAMVVDAEGRFLLHHEAEQFRTAPYDAQFLTEIDVLVDLFQMGFKDFPHLGEVHQFGLSVHELQGCN